MRLRSLALASLVVALPLAAAHADVIAPNERSITHEVFLEGFERHPDLVFVVGPIGYRGDAVAYVESDQAMASSRRFATRVYAIPRAGAPKADALTIEWLTANAVAISWHQFVQQSTVDEDAPEHRIRTVYRLGPCVGRKLVIEGVKEERFDRRDQRLPAVTPPIINEIDPTPRPGGDRRGSWAPRRDDALLVLPAIAFVGLFGTWRRRRRVV
jgi:hypothetical protein